MGRKQTTHRISGGREETRMACLLFAHFSASKLSRFSFALLVDTISLKQHFIVYHIFAARRNGNWTFFAIFACF